MKKDYITDITNGERRFFGQLPELRAGEANGRGIRGYAAVFNKDSEVFYDSWVERIAVGAFDEVLQDDCVALFNHDPNLILARNNETLRIGVDSTGLWYEFDAPNTTAGNDLLENIRLKNVKQSSFAFTVKEQTWTDEKDKLSVRTITKIQRLYDVAPVTYPAYPDTTVAKRSLESNLNDREKEAKSHLVGVMKRKHEIFQLINQ